MYGCNILIGGVIMIKILTQCPVCDGSLKAIKLKCESCGTVIENSFDFPPLMRLSRENMEFAEVFLLCRGNIKDVEKELGISYPTVRAKLDQVIESLAVSKKSSDLQVDILQQLEDGIITAEEAVVSLENIKRGGLR